MANPLIGIPCARAGSQSGHANRPVAMVQRSYVDAVSSTGGSPILIPSGLSDQALERIAGEVDGLLLAGGGDILPECYGAERRPETRSVDEERDRTELWLVRWALAHHRPVLAICRGIQILNVALGGTLYQDLASERPGGVKHDYSYPECRLDDLAHSIRIDPGTQLAAILGGERVDVNSRHHQALGAVAAGLTVTARAPDGVVEGVELPGRFVVGVQWHPENLLERVPAMRDLFRAFVREADQRSLVPPC